MALSVLVLPCTERSSFSFSAWSLSFVNVTHKQIALTHLKQQSLKSNSSSWTGVWTGVWTRVHFLRDANMTGLKEVFDSDLTRTSGVSTLTDFVIYLLKSVVFIKNLKRSPTAKKQSKIYKKLVLMNLSILLWCTTCSSVDLWIEVSFLHQMHKIFACCDQSCIHIWIWFIPATNLFADWVNSMQATVFQSIIRIRRWLTTTSVLCLPDCHNSYFISTHSFFPGSLHCHIVLKTVLGNTDNYKNCQRVEISQQK